MKKILAILTEALAMSLRPMDVVPKGLFHKLWPDEKKYSEVKLTLSVIVIAPRYIKSTDSVEVLLIKERNSFNPSQPVEKFPSGSMTIEDKNIIAAAIREFRMETGYEAREIEFCFAAEYTSTIAGERHIKIFLLAKNHEVVGAPTEKDVMFAFWEPFQNIGKTKRIPSAQAHAMKHIFDKIMGISREIVFALMNNDNFHAPMEGDNI